MVSRQRKSRSKSFSVKRLLLLISLFFKKHDTCAIFKANIDTFLYYIPAVVCKCGRHGGLMVSTLVPGASGPGSSPGRGHCVVFLGKTLNFHSASLHPGV